jgi:hypothetical protein
MQSSLSLSLVPADCEAFVSLTWKGRVNEKRRRE